MVSLRRVKIKDTLLEYNATFQDHPRALPCFYWLPGNLPVHYVRAFCTDKTPITGIGVEAETSVQRLQATR
jgi:hypothetical protein